MRTSGNERAHEGWRRLLVLVLFLALAGCVEAGLQDRPQITEIPSDAEQHYYAIEVNGTRCGYAHVVVYPTEIDGRDVELVRQKTFLLMSLLGAEVNTEIDQVYHVDPTSRQYFYADTDAHQGRQDFSWEARIEDGTAYLASTLGGKDKSIELPDDVVLTDGLYFPHLKRDFVDRGLDERTYETLNVREGKVEEVVYTLVNTETVELAGNTYETVVLDEDHTGTGVKLRVWVDTTSGLIVQGDLPDERRFYLSEPRVARQIEVANVTEDITAKVGVLIPDFQSISYMKVRAVFEPTGLEPTPAGLNVPGQTFTGSVEGNRVEGIFEIRHPRYDGTGAPPFPPDFAGDEALREHLEPSALIESDDPVLIARARELTAGAVDSWDAARRISTWVSENIDYAIPGGGTARRVHDLRAGECGGHSALVAAMCRAVGIPARLVWGCQYIPNFGGAFGQHGWNEVYMGEAAGWVPLDATSYEPDYVDSGHVRLGYYQSAASALHPVEMEVLEYRLADGGIIRPEAPPVAAADAGTAEKYGKYVGEYTGPGGRRFEVRVENGSLVIDIEGEIALPMKDPDAEGVWTCKLVPRLYATFDLDDDGDVLALRIHEIVRMRKIASPTRIDAEVPEELRGHLGDYLLAAIDKEFNVAWRHGSLAISDPGTGKYSRLEEDPDRAGTWVSQMTGNTITFQTGAGGSVEQLTLDSGARVQRR